jgi:excisionase family DNA binding protein
LLETKGREDVDVAHKDRAAMIWCENATLLTGTAWGYIKVPQDGFGKLQPTEFADLVAVFGTGSAGRASAERTVSTREAADALNVPHAFLLRLLEDGEIPCRRVDSEIRIDLNALLVFKRKLESEQGEALAELTQLSQQLGLYRDREDI